MPNLRNQPISVNVVRSVGPPLEARANSRLFASDRTGGGSGEIWGSGYRCRRGRWKPGWAYGLFAVVRPHPGRGPARVAGVGQQPAAATAPRPTDRLRPEAGGRRCPGTPVGAVPPQQLLENAARGASPRLVQTKPIFTPPSDVVLMVRPSDGPISRYLEDHRHRNAGGVDDLLSLTRFDGHPKPGSESPRERAEIAVPTLLAIRPHLAPNAVVLAIWAASSTRAPDPHRGGRLEGRTGNRSRRGRRQRQQHRMPRRPPVRDPRSAASKSSKGTSRPPLVGLRHRNRHGRHFRQGRRNGNDPIQSHRHGKRRCTVGRHRSNAPEMTSTDS